VTRRKGDEEKGRGGDWGDGVIGRS